MMGGRVEGVGGEGMDYKGFMLLGVIKVKGEGMVMEYNVGMGEGERERVMVGMKSELVELFEGVGEGKVNEKRVEIEGG